MIPIIKERGYETVTEYYLDIYNSDGEICLCFPVDECGNTIITPENKDNYEFAIKKCNDGEYTKHLSKLNRRYRTNAIARCHCGEEFELRDECMGACECPRCGQWYNLFGQELKNPKEWELGEDW